ncbi:MAG: putative Ig domain-containing protein, partial [Geobacteraceae bacterium]|nr:putative Ig domain-containing protein [Geobacteraceae bacterium]
MRNFNKIFHVIMFSFFMISAIATLSDAKSLNTLEIGFPREAGTGSPAIPATHPVFRAHPEVAYSVRPAIYGGAYPFTFTLANQPEGMVVDSSTGLVTWPNPQASTGPITLTVTDADGTQAQSTWSVTVSASGFVFVDSSYSGVETGSISQPYSSIANMLNGSTTATDIVYFRAGTHSL